MSLTARRPTGRPTTRPTTRPVLLALASVAVLLGGLTACGGADATATDPTSVDAQAGSGALEGGSGGNEGFTLPGARGTIAAVDGTTLQVRNDQSGQVAVSYSDATTITAQVTGSVDDIVVGSCVRVTSPDGTGDDTGDEDSAVTAATVTVTEKVDGTCSAAGGGFGAAGARGRDGTAPGGGTPPTDLPDLPEGAPDGAAPTDRPEGARGFGGGVSGEVSAVDAGTITVEVSVPGDDATTSTSVLLEDSTTVTTTQDSDADSLTVGECVVAMGDADSTGAVTAETIQVSDPVDGACQTGGPGGFGGTGGRGAPDDASRADS